MSNIAQDFVEEYIRKTIRPSQGILRDMENYAAENNIPVIHPEVARFLEVIIKGCKCKKILEVGTAIGYSAIIMAGAAGEGASITTIEIDQAMEEKAREFTKRAGLEDRIEIVSGDARDILKEMDGSFDFVFIDGAKGHYKEMLEACLNLVKPGGLIACDNVLFRGMVADDRLVKRRKITIVKRMRKFLDFIANHPLLDTAIVPIGDGLSVSYRKEA